MTDIQAPQARAFAAIHVPAAGVDSTAARVQATINFPSTGIRSPQAAVHVTVHANKEIRVPQTRLMVAAIGRIAEPYVRAFTMTLDGHDFYALRLGDDTTLLYDVSSQQWVEWTSPDLQFWRVNCAVNWVGAQKIAQPYGSDIVAGDDTWGVLYFMDPTAPFDQHPDYLNGQQDLAFDRIVMAQTTVPGRQFIPCYAIFVDGDNYGQPLDGNIVPYVKLETSDDQGQTFTNQGTITAQPNTLDQDYRWTSLGQMQSPGRLFRLTNNGLLTRIDAMEMNDS